MERKGVGRTKRVLGWALTITSATTALAQSAPTSSGSSSGRPQRQVIVSIPDRKLVVMEKGAVVRMFPVAVGAQGSPSPTGSFVITSRLTSPTYYHAGVVIPPGKGNPLGPRWVGLNKQGYGIHGTNVPSSVGRAASHGCIRLRNQDIVQFFALVRVGDAVKIHGERDELISQIFGGQSTEVAVVARAQTAAGGPLAGSQ